MATVASKQVRIGGAELEAALSEASGFSPEKFAGFEDLARRIGTLSGERLSLDEAFEFELSYSDAEAMRTELVFSAGMDKNVNFGLKLTPFGVPGMISIARPILYGWLEYVLGGSRNEEIVYPQREPTELELRIGQVFCRFVCDALIEAFADFPAAMSADILLPTPESGHGRWMRRDSQFGILYDAALGPVTGEVMIVLPLRILDALRTVETKKAGEGEQLPDPQWGVLLNKAVNKTRLDMLAVLGRTQMTLEDVAGLKVGQVVGLGLPARDPLVVEAGGKPVFRAQLGRTNGRYTLKFEQMLETENWDGPAA